MLRALSSHRFNSGTWYCMWFEFVVGSCPCLQVFLQGPPKTNIEIQFDLESVDKKSHRMECLLLNSHSHYEKLINNCTESRPSS